MRLIDVCFLAPGLALTVLQSAILGALAGGAICMAPPIVYLALVGLSVIISFRKSRPVLFWAIWGGTYQIGSGLWLLPALDSLPLLVPAICALFSAGVLFYGTASLVLKWRVGRYVWPVTMALAEIAATRFGGSLAPIGLGAIGTPFSYIVTLGSVYYATIVILAALVLLSSLPPLAGVALGIVLAASFAIEPASTPNLTGLRVVGISHHPDAHLKWKPDYSGKVLAQLKQRTSAINDADLIIWPENAVTTTFNLDKAIKQIGPVSTPLLFGMNRYAKPGQPELVNSAVLLQGGKVSVSDKEVLAPFLEGGFYLFLAPALQSGRRKPFTLANGQRFIVLICFEAAFSIPPEDLKGVDFIVVISAETGFWQDMATRVMNKHAAARSLEAGLPVIRVSDV